MKNLFLSICLLMTGLSSFAGSDQYMNAMKGIMMKMSGATSPEAYQVAGNAFERVANSETKEWQPRYYAAFCYVMQAMMTEDKSKVDGIADQADKLLNDAAAINDNDEIIVLKSMCMSARIGVDPMSRGMKFGMEASKLLTQAKEKNPANPRIYLLMGQNKFYTPEAFGGGKKAAAEYFTLAVEKFAAFKPADELAPTWGLESAQKMLEQCK